MYSKELIGKEVVGSDALRMGDVAGLVVDKATWQIVLLEVGLDDDVVKDLRSAGALADQRCAISVGQVEGVGDKVVLKIDRRALSELIRQPPPPLAAAAAVVGPNGHRAAHDRVAVVRRAYPGRVGARGKRGESVLAASLSLGVRTSGGLYEYRLRPDTTLPSSPTPSGVGGSSF